MINKKCYFCNNSDPCGCETIKLYKTIQKQFTGLWKVFYSETTVNIPICENCISEKKKELKSNFFIYVIAFFINLLIAILPVYYIIGPKVDDEIEFWDSVLISGILAFVFIIPMVKILFYIRYLYFNKPDVDIKSLNHPVILELENHNWQTEKPDPKYGPFKNKLLDDFEEKEIVNNEYKKAIIEANIIKENYADYLY